LSIQTTCGSSSTTNTLLPELDGSSVFRAYACPPEAGIGPLGGFADRSD
jgi:hypothetical protein